MKININYNLVYFKSKLNIPRCCGTFSNYIYENVLPQLTCRLEKIIKITLKCQHMLNIKY